MHLIIHRWHADGALERVKCVCVYYYHIDEGMTGGELAFRPMAYGERLDVVTTQSTNDLNEDIVDSKTKTYTIRENDEDAQVEINVKQNDIFIWNQYDLIHRVCDISIGKNKRLSKTRILKQPKKVYHRGFLNFFIVDPMYPTPRTSLNSVDPSDLTKNKHYQKYLISSILTIINQQYHQYFQMCGYMPLEIATVIYEFAFDPLRTAKQSKEVRSHIAKNRNDEGYIEYFQNGNEATYIVIWEWQPYTGGC